MPDAGYPAVLPDRLSGAGKLLEDALCGFYRAISLIEAIRVWHTGVRAAFAGPKPGTSLTGGGSDHRISL
jgi:hypothetical protein